MTAKEYLETLRKLDIQIKQRQLQAEELRQLITSVGGIDYSKERVQTSNYENAISENIINLIKMENEIYNMIGEYAHKKDKIVSEIHKLDNINYIKLLYMRYVDCLKLEQIAINMNYSYNRIKHIHGLALKEFQDKILNIAPNST